MDDHCQRWLKILCKHGDRKKIEFIKKTMVLLKEEVDAQLFNSSRKRPLTDDEVYYLSNGRFAQEENKVKLLIDQDIDSDPQKLDKSLEIDSDHTAEKKQFNPPTFTNTEEDICKMLSRIVF
jgi:hypothetical protein